jgi:UDP-N-acetyl-D-mannosaminuronic acid dehydrogenase
MKTGFRNDVCIVGGLGHVGLPLGLSLAEKGLSVIAYDVNEKSASQVQAGKLPFLEVGGEDLLKKVIGQTFHVSTELQSVAECKFVIIVIGTPVDEHLNPKFALFKKFIDSFVDLLSDEQHIILRSTVYPGITEKIQRYLRTRGKQCPVSFCPERIVQGQALHEIASLPQIVASFDEAAFEEAAGLFSRVASEVVRLEPAEAELAKLFSNVWRYIQFATANQFYTIASQNGLDYYKIHKAMTHKYPRAQGMPIAGFAAGPCLFKDTMQLAAYSGNRFFLGHSAMLINEGLPYFILASCIHKKGLKS